MKLYHILCIQRQFLKLESVAALTLFDNSVILFIYVFILFYAFFVFCCFCCFFFIFFFTCIHSASFDINKCFFYQNWFPYACMCVSLSYLELTFHLTLYYYFQIKEVREKSRECHNHKPQPFPNTKRKRKPTNPNKHKSNKRTKSTKISSLFPMRGNRNTKRTEKHKNKMTHGKTYNK